MPIVVEWDEGEIREGKTEDGKEWSRVMPFPYGYIKDTKGAGDKEGVDVYIGANEAAPFAYVIEQKKEDGSLDEYKVMLGFDSEAEAVGAYSLGFSDGMGYARLDGDELTTGVRAMPVAELRRWALAAGSVPVDRWEPRPSESAARPTPTPSQEQESSR
jgi:hypothetical protein